MVLLDLTRLTDGQIPAAFAWKIKEDLTKQYHSF
jgi:hypothetical protein